jgi:DNA repair protein RadD
MAAAVSSVQGVRAAAPVAITVDLRGYQIEAIEKLRELIRQGVRRILLVIPTGGGKTLTAGSMIAGSLRKGRRALFAAHRKEIIDQTVRALARLGILSIGVIRASDKRRDASQPVQVASIDTLRNRESPDAALVFVDEAHRSMAASYRKHIFEAYPDRVIVGLTATPCRTDGKPLGELYEAIVIGATYSQLIAEGYIAEPLVYSTPVLPDLSGVHRSGADYNQEELEEACNRAFLIGDVVETWEKRAEGRRSVFFAVGVAHSRAICAAFVARGHKAEHLDGTTPDALRDAILARLASGETRIVCQCAVLTEGWDCPAVKYIGLVRPTKSLVVYMQAAGRGMRPWCPCGCDRPSECQRRVRPIIVDHGKNVDEHGMPHEDRDWSLDKKVKRPGSPPQKACPACFAFIPSALMQCSHCGYEFPVPQPAEPEPREVLDKVELTLRTLSGDDAQLAFFRKVTRTARERGWKPGAVNHRFQERFGKLPPREWYVAVKRSAKKDPEWAAKLAAKEAAAQ